MQPEFEDEEAFDPFDFWQGANFRLKAKDVAGYRNYDSSDFATPGPLLKDDDAMEELWKKQYPLAELISNDKFKSYEDLKTRLDYVLGTKVPTRRQDSEEYDEDDNRGPLRDLDENLRSQLNSLQPSSTFEEEEDESLEYFKKLALED